MEYFKSVVVLKQITEGFSVGSSVVSGIARVEVEDGVSTFFLTTVNFSAVSNGEYIAVVVDGKNKTYTFPLGKSPRSVSKVFNGEPNTEKGIAVGICYIKDDIPVVVAFQRSQGRDYSLFDFKKTVADMCIQERKQRQKEKTDEKKEPDVEPIVSPPTEPVVNPEIPIATPLITPSVTPTFPTTPFDNPTVIPFVVPIEKPEKENPDTVEPDPEKALYGIYNDEAVATENYYELDKEIENKMKVIREMENESLSNGNGERHSDGKEKEEESECNPLPIQNEADDDGEKYSAENPFYKGNEQDLNELFDKFAEFKPLKKVFPQSRWVKIDYSENKYYVVGEIKEKGKIKYICYGVPSVYSETPPKELDGYCSFIPLSIFDLKGDGFWMMFQDAITGECVHKSK